MANWYYYNKNGEKVGPISTTTLKSLALQGVITRETNIENNNGRSLIAGKVTGLEFPKTTQTDASPPVKKTEIYGMAGQTSVPNPPATTRVQDAPTYFYMDVNGQKQGPINKRQLDELAARGIIKPNTQMETKSGQKGFAGQISGLFPPSASPSPPVPQGQPGPNNSANLPPQKSIQDIKKEVQTLTANTKKTIEELAVIRTGIAIMASIAGGILFFIFIFIAGAFK